MIEMSVQENTEKVNSIIRKAQKEVKSAEQQFAYEKSVLNERQDILQWTFVM